MIIAIIMYFTSGLLAVITGVLNGIAFVTPSWVATGETDILSAPAKLQGILPMYPNPNMTGIASQTGLMPMFGFLLLILTTVVTIGIVWGAINVFLRILGRGRSSSLSTTSDAEA